MTGMLDSQIKYITFKLDFTEHGDFQYCTIRLALVLLVESLVVAQTVG